MEVANATAGDSDYLREGKYTGQLIRPANYRTSDDERIIFSGHQNETVVFEESDGIQIEQKSYIAVTGME